VAVESDPALIHGGVGNWHCTCTWPVPSSTHPAKLTPSDELQMLLVAEKAPASFEYGTTHAHVPGDAQRDGRGAQKYPCPLPR
jgi:hypothetical protein